MFQIAGAGLAGLACGYELARRGARVVIYEAAQTVGTKSVARFAGGMLAPWCERESAEEDVIRLGAGSADWWSDITPVERRGTLVVATGRDQAELTRFAQRTSGHRSVSAGDIAALEPDLESRFQRGLFFENEAHLDPRRALCDLADAVEALGGEIRRGENAPDDVDIDCTGMAADISGLRPVRGEMAILCCPEVTLSRTVRLLHPRIPLYLVPRADGHYMIGATMIESSSTRAATLRSLSELFSAAFTLHPAFAEAAIVETGAGLRPAFADNLPRVTHVQGKWHLNGLYRHGFLLAPAMAKSLAQKLLSETDHENHRERRTA
ncbi:FAD-dependent oxidoreductase [Thalassococcus sp. S3]|uniref:FAD-dependent oxidoreductase n=1 Tax=Thalassococcus sp. S3 TaxID=2017482 RepID=UPI0010245101|nr:FAD-dependent oxidoreductase [Thalassococcus sp. S3]QBF33044.1 FAD-dependent oxidoreductase [Thalassococcus sp. S3]